MTNLGASIFAPLVPVRLMSAPQISIIIPTLNEAHFLPQLLEALAEEDVPAEVIIVDGGSRDGTVEAAAARGATVLQAGPGRGQQLAFGARKARGDVLLFLHADTTFPAGGLGRIADHLQDSPDAVGGNFRLVFDGRDGFSRWLTGFYAWIRRRGLYYGDSAVFVRRAVYDKLGGIRPLALMEDLEFNRRLERAGLTLCIEDPALLTSSRKFRGRHPASIIAGWLFIHALYFLGVSPKRLAAYYYGDSKRDPQRGAV